MSVPAPRTWRLVLPGVLTALALSATAAVALAPPDRSAASVASLLGAAAPAGMDLRAVDLAGAPSASMPSAASAAQLGAALTASAAAMGVRPPAGEEAVADLPPAVRGGLVQALDVLTTCAATTSSALDRLGGAAGLAAAMRQERQVDPGVGVRLLACAGDLRAALAGLELAVRAARAPSADRDTSCLPEVALWPVLAVDLREDDDTCYRRDFALLVDGGGDDLYDNNAGSNLLDLLRGGESDEARARGCRHAVAGLVARDCVPVAAALLDLDGDDTYGLFEPPYGDLGLSVPLPPAPPEPVPDPFKALRPTDRPGDTHCTREHVVARVSTQGAGLLGVGMLVDSDGDDVYLGKTGSQGTGHFFGVGALVDEAGDDLYSAVRTSQGFGLFGGSGLLVDRSGDDTYAERMPAAKTGVLAATSDGEEPVFLDPGGTLNPASGIGGVIDDAGFCDNNPRFLQGAANVGSVGVLLDRSGRDAYTAGGGARLGDEPITARPVDRSTGSQGFGSQGSVGALLDLEDGSEDGADRKGSKGRTQDLYSAPERGNDRLRVDCTVGGAGLFLDGTGTAPGDDAAVTAGCTTALTAPAAPPSGTSGR